MKTSFVDTSPLQATKDVNIEIPNNEEIKLKWQKRIMYVMVDEFQDVSKNNYLLVEILQNYHKNFY